MTTARAFTLSRIPAFIFFVFSVSFAFAYQAGERINVESQLAPMKSYYDARADWPRSHGWKPFKRYEWDVSQRMSGDGTIPAGALWEAHLQRQRMPRTSLDETWTPLGPFNHGGRTRVLRFHPDDPAIMYAGSVGGGLFRSVNSGQSWEPVTDDLPNLAVGCFEIHPTTPNIMFLGTGEGYFNGDAIRGIGLLKSTDGGLTWQTTGLAYPYAQGKAMLAICLDPRDPDIVLASNNDGLYRSTNGGTTFGMVRAGNVSVVKRDPQNLDNLLCGVASPFNGGGDIYRSTDNGITWTPSGSGLPPSNRIGRIVLNYYPGNSQIIWAGICGTFSYNGSQMIGVYRSTDNGVNWIQMSQDGQNHYSSQGWYDMAIAVKPDNPNVVFSSGLDLYRSTNSGFHWSRITRWDLNFGNPDYVHADHHEIVFHPDDPEEVWAVTDGGIFKSVDAGDNWTEMSQGYNTFQYYAMGNATLDTVITYGGTQDNGTSRYNGSPNWEAVFGGDGGYCVVDYTNNNTLYVEYQNGNRFRSDNGGGSFTSINGGINGTGAWVCPMVLDPFDNLTIYTTTRNGIVWMSPNQGRQNNWENIGNVGGTNQVIAPSPLVPGLLYLGSSSAVYSRNPETGDWSLITGNLPNATVTRVVPDPLNPDGIFVTLSGFGHGHVFKSTQGSGVWDDISGNLPDCPFQDVIVDQTESGTLYAGGDLGVYRTTDGGLSWEIFGDGLPVVRVDDMEMQTVTGKLRIATHGRGIWEISTGSSDLALLYPNGGETVLSGNFDTLRFERVLVNDPLLIELNRDYPDGNWETLASSVGTQDEHRWIVQLPAGEACRVRITSETRPELFDISDGDFTLRAPVMTMLAPNGGEEITVGSDDEIRWDASEHQGRVRITLNRSYPDGTWEIISSNAMNNGSYQWTPSDPATTDARVRVAAMLDPLQTFTESAADFTIMGLTADDNPLPTKFRVSEAYPNPFNPSTQVTLELPARTHVEAVVFNHLGQEVVTLSDGMLDAGAHHLTFNAPSLSSGTYFIHLSAFGETRILKAVLLK